MFERAPRGVYTGLRRRRRRVNTPAACVLPAHNLPKKYIRTCTRTCFVRFGRRSLFRRRFGLGVLGNVFIQMFPYTHSHTPAGPVWPTGRGREGLKLMCNIALVNVCASEMQSTANGARARG